MTREQKRSAIKRINQRTVQMAETFGDQSAAVQSYMSDIKTLIPHDYIKPYKGKGNYNIISISHSNAACDNIPDDRIQAMLAKPTAKDIVKHEKEQIAEETGRRTQDVTMEEVRTYENERTFVEKWIDEHGDTERYNAFSAAFKGYSGVPSYGDLKAAIELYEESRKKTQNKKAPAMTTFGVYIVYDDGRKETRSVSGKSAENIANSINTNNVKFASILERGKKTGKYYNGKMWK